MKKLKFTSVLIFVFSFLFFVTTASITNAELISYENESGTALFDPETASILIMNKKPAAIKITFHFTYSEEAKKQISKKPGTNPIGAFITKEYTLSKIKSQGTISYIEFDDMGKNTMEYFAQEPLHSWDYKKITSGSQDEFILNTILEAIDSKGIESFKKY